jgi:exopolysaccharide biosynthesis protein
MAVARLPELAPGGDRGAVAFRVALPDGAGTTAYVAVHPVEHTDICVVALPRPEPLVSWCRRNYVEHAIVGGFFTRPNGVPLGEMRLNGVRMASDPFDSPWAGIRSCVHVCDGAVTIAPRDELPQAPAGDLLQAGPMLVREGRSLIDSNGDPEGFSSGQRQFDSDITVGRYPRAALGVGQGLLIAVACDGRGTVDAGVTLGELATLMVRLGASAAINLDGGGSTSLISDGRLVNRPREEHGLDLPVGRPISTALLLLPRA